MSNLMVKHGLKGWFGPHSSRRFHIFKIDDRSLCGKWGSLSVPADAFSPVTSTVGVTGQDCEGCLGRLRKLEAKS